MIKLKILGLTDLHTGGIIPLEDIRKVVEDEKIDLIILAGDLTTFGSSDLVKKVLEEFALLERTIFYIPGNMDSVNSGAFEFSRVKPLHARVIYYQGINFLGLGASNPTPFNTPFTLEEKELTKLLVKMKTEIKNESPIFLVSHAPPFATEADKIHSGAHVGSTAVKDFIEKEHPFVVLCGHIHESKSLFKMNDTLCINPGPARHRNGTIIEIKKSKEGEIKASGKLIIF